MIENCLEMDNIMTNTKHYGLSQISYTSGIYGNTGMGYALTIINGENTESYRVWARTYSNFDSNVSSGLRDAGYSYMPMPSECKKITRKDAKYYTLENEVIDQINESFRLQIKKD